MAGGRRGPFTRSAMTNFRVSMPRTDTSSVALLGATGEQEGLRALFVNIGSYLSCGAAPRALCLARSHPRISPPLSSALGLAYSVPHGT